MEKERYRRTKKEEGKGREEGNEVEGEGVCVHTDHKNQLLDTKHKNKLLIIAAQNVDYFNLKKNKTDSI
jgi:hypothetical protein